MPAGAMTPMRFGRALDALVQRLLAEAPAAELVRRAVQQTAPAAAKEIVIRRGRASPPPTASEIVRPTKDEVTGIVAIPIFYGTDRRPRRQYAGELFWRRARGIRVRDRGGRACQRAAATLGELTGPSWWRLVIYRPIRKSM